MPKENLADKKHKMVVIIKTCFDRESDNRRSLNLYPNDKKLKMFFYFRIFFTSFSDAHHKNGLLKVGHKETKRCWDVTA